MNSDNKKNSRRDFLRTSATGTAMALGLSHIVSQAFARRTSEKIALRQDDIILFQGDSITDAGRNRDDKGMNNSRALGSGYAFLAGAKLLHDHASKNLKIYNRGISGNKVYQLAERWDEDCLELKPTVLSILIGVNDFWHMVNGKYDGTIETYRDDFKALLQRTKQEFPDIKLIIGEPFAVPGIKAVDGNWFPRFKEYQSAARELAGQFNAAFIPYQSVFDQAAKKAPTVYWTHDGVHPSLPGSQLMAEAMLANFGN